MNNLTDNLRIAALPLDIQWAAKDANLRAVDEAVKALPAGTDVLVLPELFTTGYADDPRRIRSLAEPDDGPTMTHMRAMAAHYSIAIAGSFAGRSGEAVTNRGFFIEPGGDTTYYNKRHLFSPGSEAEAFTAGTDTVPVVRFRGWNIALTVCYDLRFPVWCRAVAGNYDLMLVVANWPASRQYAFEHLLIARAIENQAAIVGANRGGKDYDGLTQIYNCMGRPVGTPDGPYVTATLSRRQQTDYRRNFPVMNDADSFTINI